MRCSIPIAHGRRPKHIHHPIRPMDLRIPYALKVAVGWKEPVNGFKSIPKLAVLLGGGEVPSFEQGA
jgi:hypothetical protein